MLRSFFCLAGFLLFSPLCPAADDGHGTDAAAAKPITDDGPALTVEVFAEAPEVKNITTICFDEAGDLFVAETYRFRHGIEDNRNHRYWLMDDVKSETSEDRRAMYGKWMHQFDGPDYFTRDSERVLRLRDTDMDGSADEVKVFADNFRDALDGPAIGLLAGEPGEIYLTCIPHLWKLSDRDGDGFAERRESIQSGFGPKVSLSGHDLHGLAWGPDGKLYFSLGDRGFNLETKDGEILKDVNSGAAFRCNPDGTEMEVFYHQLRNPQELAFNEYGDLFTVDNNCDQGDEARICYLIEGGNSGWIVGTQNLTTFADDIEAGGLGDEPFWMSENLWKTRHAEQPQWILPPVFNLTNGPAGLVFNSGISLPDRYKNHFLICDYRGSSAQSLLYSFSADLSGASYAVRDPHVFHKGVTNTDVELGYDGRIYLADYGGGWMIPNQGVIYALSVEKTRERALVKYTQSLFKDGFRQRKSGELAVLLEHPDMRVRLRSQFELARRGDEGLAVFGEISKSAGAEFFSRLHAIWGLRQLHAAEKLRPLLTDENAEIRAQAARALGDLHDRKSADALTALLGDSSLRVQSLAGIAVGKVGGAKSIPAVLSLLEKNKDADLFVRHGGVMALTSIASPDVLQKLTSHKSDAIRIAAVLALRRLESAKIADFLSDKNPAIAAEAMRAINDVPILGAIPALADFHRPATSPLLFRRILNANLRSDDPAHAANLLAIASDEKYSAAERILALRFLSNWLTPPPIDPTMGVYRPLPDRITRKAEVAAILSAPLTRLIDTSSGDLTAWAMKSAEVFGIRIDPGQLVKWMSNVEIAPSVRVAAIERLKESEPGKITLALLDDSNAEVRAAAGKALGSAQAVEKLVARDSILDKRAAYEIIATSTLPETTAILHTEWEKIAGGKIPAEVRLDLYNAAAARGDAKVGEIPADQLNSFTLFGGNAEHGQAVFFNQGTCLKCHIIGSQGGNAGPDLSDIALRQTPEEILASVMDPNTVIVPGYGICTVTLQDGSHLSGSPLEEDSQQLILKSGATDPQTISKSSIQSMTPVISPMPPMGQALSKSDLRDLMAFLSEQKTAPR